MEKENIFELETANIEEEIEEITLRPNILVKQKLKKI